jgi:hypothetical protein
LLAIGITVHAVTLPFTLALALSLCVLAVGCSAEPHVPDDASTARVSIAGEWDIQWGTTPSAMTISQSGSSVTSRYDLSTSSGSISGTLDGYVLMGRYSDKYGSGAIRLTFSSDGRSFEGTWGGGGATWNGQRRQSARD